MKKSEKKTRRLLTSTPLSGVVLHYNEEEWWKIAYWGMSAEDAAGYMRRWGIETGIRSAGEFLPKTNSTKPAYRSFR